MPLVEYAGNFSPQPPPEFLEIAREDYDLLPGRSKMIMYGRIPVLLVRAAEPESALMVFVAICPHLNCTVSHKEGDRRIYCACHEGYFDLNGEVLSGPPPRPLRQFYSRFTDGKLVIALERENLEKAS